MAGNSSGGKFLRHSVPKLPEVSLNRGHSNVLTSSGHNDPKTLIT